MGWRQILDQLAGVVARVNHEEDVSQGGQRSSDDEARLLQGLFLFISTHIDWWLHHTYNDIDDLSPNTERCYKIEQHLNHLDILYIILLIFNNIAQLDKITNNDQDGDVGENDW